MVKRDELIKFIYQTIGKGLLEKAAKVDEVANGVQILGKEDVAKVAIGASLNEDFLKEAVRWGADFCIFHHGFDPRTFKSCYPISAQKRLKLIFENDLTIAGFHFCLDAHPQIGNNAVIIKKLGARISHPFYKEGWGFIAKFFRPQPLATLKSKCVKLFNHDVFAVIAAKKAVRTIAVVSGGGKPDAQDMTEMEEKGVELFISGEPTESMPYKLSESGISYFAGGHYNTEVFGVQALGEKIKAEFKDRLKVKFIDIPNPV